VRTGIVIQSAQATESISAKKTPGDLNFSQTIVKAQTDAIGKALLRLAYDVVTFAGTAKMRALGWHRVIFPITPGKRCYRKNGSALSITNW
jgi:hypothetical protein